MGIEIRQDMKEVNWGFSECYRKLYDLKTPESNAHPAKMSMQLCFKILKKLMKDGKLKYGDTVLDFMAGIGTTAICWLYMHPSNRAITLELEPHFIKMQEDNKAYLEKKLGRRVAWEIIQGDARRLSEILQERGLVGITSPPYSDSKTHPSIGSVNKDKWIKEEKDIVGRRGLLGQAHYSKSKKNIGNLPDRIVGVTSPPYFDGKKGMVTANQVDKFASIMEERDKELNRNWGKDRHTPGRIRAFKSMSSGYSKDPKNIGNLPDRIVGITSPPYSEAQSGGGIAKEGYRGKHINEMGKNQPDKVGERCGYMKDVCGKSPNNIANFPDKIVGVVSPPWEDNIESGLRAGKFRNPEAVARAMAEKSGKGSYHGATVEARLRQMERDEGRVYGDSDGQIGREQGETYLSAMQKVYEEAAKCCSVLVTVTKNPTRQGKLRRLDIDTRKLCEDASYQTYNHAKAHLFEEVEQATLDGKVKKTPRGRLSFFKRLQYQKSDGKAEIAKWEDVLFFERPEAFL